MADNVIVLPNRPSCSGRYRTVYPERHTHPARSGLVGSERRRRGAGNMQLSAVDYANDSSWFKV